MLRAEVLGAEVLTKTQFEARGGDFLISRRQIIHGACGVVPDSLDGAVVSNEYSTLRSRNTLLTEFLSYYSHTPYFQRTCFHSSHGVDVEKMIFKLDAWLAREFDLPPIQEQRKIAAILSSVDEAIEKTQAVIDQVQFVKKGLMQELLTRGLPGRHTKFKQTEIGEIPEEWEVVELGEVLTAIDAGWSPQCEAYPAGPDEWGVLKVSAVTSGVYLDVENKALPPSMPARSDIEVRSGDVILARANGVLDLVGKTVLVTATRSRLMLSDKLLRLQPIESRISGAFLTAALAVESVRARLLSTTGGSHMRNISQANLRQLRMPLPNLAEQNRMSDAIQAVAARESAEVQLRGGLTRLKQALMSVLLTGEVRVKVDPEPTP